MGENNNVLIKEIIAGLNQPEWGCVVVNDSRAGLSGLSVGSSAHPATITPTSLSTKPQSNDVQKTSARCSSGLGFQMVSRTESKNAVVAQPM